MATQQERADEAAVAQAFVSARDSGRVLADYPGGFPRDLAAAYRIQDEAIRLTDAAIGGWKVGRINPPLGRVDRLSGPIFAHRIVSAAPVPTMPIFEQGFGAAEAEFLLRIAMVPEPGRTRFTHDDVCPLIDAVHVGIEIASSPFPGINDHGAPVTVSDFGNNHGLVVGEQVPPDLLAAPVELWVNDERIGAGTTETMPNGPFGAAAFLFENLAARGIAVQPGQWISTGAVTGVHRVRAGDRVEARFGATHRVRCDIAAS